MPRNNTESRLNSETDPYGIVLDRRAYLLAAGTTAAIGSGVFAGRASATTTHHGVRFKHTVDMVADVECDPSGNEPCDEQIKDAADDYTLLKFPEGTYKLTQKNVILGMTNLGFVGEGDVRFTVPEEFNEKVLIVDKGTGIVFEGIDIDLTASGATPGLQLAADDDLEVHDVEFIGQGIHPDSAPRSEGDGNPSVTNAFTPIVRSSDGVGHVSDFTAKNNGLMGAYNQGNGRVGIWTGMQHKGTITLENCHIEGFPNNATYCSRTPGTVQIERGVFRNNDVSQIRISTSDSYVANATIEVDFDNSDSPNPEDTLNARGVRFEAGSYGYGGAVAKNCDVGVLSVPNSSGAIVVGSDGADHTVRDMRIQVNTDGVRGLHAYAPTGYGSRDPPPEPHTITLENTSITGEAADAEAVYINDRPDSSVMNCCIYQTGSNRDGVIFVDSSENIVKNSTINVEGDAVVAEDCDPETSGISESGSCPTPEFITESASEFDEGSGSTLTIEGAPEADYEFAASGKVNQSTAFDATVDSNDDLEGSNATGQVGGGGRDSYTFSSEITRLVLDGGANLYFNGEKTDPAEYLPNTVTIESDTSAGYELTTSDGLVKSTAADGATIDSNDHIAGTTATGQVGGGGKDSYAYPGKLTDLSITGEATVYRNGKELDSDKYNSIDVITIEGAPDADYELGVDESLERTTMFDATVDSNDSVSGTTAMSHVGDGGRDSYIFSGEITHLVLNGGANLYFNGEKTDPAEYLPNTVTIESDTHAEYELTTSDGVVKSTAADGATVDSPDNIEGITATGQVGEGGKDSYAYPGELTNLDVTGDVTVYRDGTVLENPEQVSAKQDTLPSFGQL